MKTILWSARWSTAKGWFWKNERECIDTGADWLNVFQKNEQDVLFVLSEKMPSKAKLSKLQRTTI